MLKFKISRKLINDKLGLLKCRAEVFGGSEKFLMHLSSDFGLELSAYYRASISISPGNYKAAETTCSCLGITYFSCRLTPDFSNAHKPCDLSPRAVQRQLPSTAHFHVGSLPGKWENPLTREGERQR